MKVPCKDCLILGICKHKKNIECYLVYEWIHTCRTRREASDELYAYLPIWQSVCETSSKWRRVSLNPDRFRKIDNGNTL